MVELSHMYCVAHRLIWGPQVLFWRPADPECGAC